MIDTNSLIRSINRKNEEFEIYRAFDKAKFDWVVSTEILNEYYEKLTEFYSQETAELVINILITSKNIVFAEPYFRWNLIVEDPDDNKFVDLAFAINAKYLVTNDKHFNILKKIAFPKINVIKSKPFAKLLAELVS